MSRITWTLPNSTKSPVPKRYSLAKTVQCLLYRKVCEGQSKKNVVSQKLIGIIVIYLKVG